MPLGNPPPSTALTNPMTNSGDIITGGSAGTPQRLAIGANKTLLASDGSAVAYDASPTVSGALIAEGGVAAGAGVTPLADAFKALGGFFPGNQNSRGYRVIGATATVAASGTLTLTTTAPLGLVIVFNASDGHGRLVWSVVGSAIFDIGPAGTNFVVGSDTGSTIAIYNSGGALVIKNRTAGNQVLSAHLIG